MTGFKSKRQATTDLMREGDAWEQEQGDLLHDFAIAILAVIGIMAVSAATGFFMGVMFATHGSLFK
jgi:hypothetical protein